MRPGLDPDADLGRRAWLPCPRCSRGLGCAVCRAGRSCERHWSYLLGTEGRRIFVQCNGCYHRWWHDTGFGAGDRRVGTGGPGHVPLAPRRAA